MPGKREGAPSRALSIADLALRQENAGKDGVAVAPLSISFARSNVSIAARTSGSGSVKRPCSRWMTAICMLLRARLFSSLKSLRMA